MPLPNSGLAVNPNTGGGGSAPVALGEPPSPPRQMTPQQPNSGGAQQVGSIQSTPNTRNAVDAPTASELAYFSVRPSEPFPSGGELAIFGGGAGGAGVPGDGSGAGAASIGDTQTEAAQDRLDALTTEVQGEGALGAVASTEDQIAQANAAKKGVLGCISRNASGGGSPTDSCSGECETVDCLAELLTGNLLSVDAKAILCDTIRASEKAAARQVANVGSALLDAANAVVDAGALQAPLEELDSAFSSLDPGAVAACFGAQDVIDSARGQLRSVNNTLSDATGDANAALADSFNEGIEKTQQFAALPEDIC